MRAFLAGWSGAALPGALALATAFLALWLLARADVAHLEAMRDADHARYQRCVETVGWSTSVSERTHDLLLGRRYADALGLHGETQ